MFTSAVGKQHQNETVQSPMALGEFISSWKWVHFHSNSFIRRQVMISLMELSPLVASEYAKMTSAQKDQFEAEFTRRRKDSGKGWLFWFFSCHYLYFGDVGKQLAYWFTIGGLGIWVIMDAVNMQRNIDRYNQRISDDAFTAVRAFAYPASDN